MFIHGTIRCEKCGKEFEWDFSVPHHKGIENLFAESMPTTKRQEAFWPSKIEEHKYSLFVRCPYCDYRNTFIYDGELYPK